MVRNSHIFILIPSNAEATFILSTRLQIFLKPCHDGIDISYFKLSKVESQEYKDDKQSEF